MKPLFVKRTGAWFFVLIVGVVLVGAGLLQAPQETGALKGSGVGGAPVVNIQANPAAGQKTRATEPALPDGVVNQQQKKEALSGDTVQGSKSAKQNEFFVEYRLERDRTRSQQIDLLREIVNNQNSVEETRKEAQRRMLAITQAIDTEMKLENLIKAENFKDVVVFVQDKSVTLIVETPVLTPLDKNRLTEIAVRVTGLTQESIVIIAKV